jgi:hypothetical protein
LRTLLSHTGRDRHTDACEGFTRARHNGTDQRGKGESYVSAVDDNIATAVIARLAANASLAAEVQAAVTGVDRPPRDEIRLARIRRDRKAAMQRLEDVRDVGRWQAEMARFDREVADAETGATTAMASSDRIA